METTYEVYDEVFGCVDSEYPTRQEAENREAAWKEYAESLKRM